MPTTYDEDPRVTEVEPGVYHVHDEIDEPDVEPWTVRLSLAGDRANVWGPDGTLVTDLPNAGDVEGAIYDIIGDPLWESQAQLLGEAAEGHGYIDPTEIRTASLSAAMFLLMELGAFRAEPEAGPAHRFNLTPDGMALWEQFGAIYDACGGDKAKLDEGQIEVRQILADLNASLAAA